MSLDNLGSFHTILLKRKEQNMYHHLQNQLITAVREEYKLWIQSCKSIQFHEYFQQIEWRWAQGFMLLAVSELSLNYNANKEQHKQVLQEEAAAGKKNTAIPIRLLSHSACNVQLKF